ncbi:uncharacterized protein A4U43_C01F6470 [Asparagus officinalis]|uniref:Uncharacterized protein n=1 Tax=Asparagus officinalis TaxID=4686 RepID=A0A5P1FMI6_ASPOF|nr:uncharacterized protein A4U43_C01F6470 [Asparagus officinalis]
MHEFHNSGTSRPSPVTETIDLRVILFLGIQCNNEPSFRRLTIIIYAVLLTINGSLIRISGECFCSSFALSFDFTQRKRYIPPITSRAAAMLNKKFKDQIFDSCKNSTLS